MITRLETPCRYLGTLIPQCYFRSCSCLDRNFTFIPFGFFNWSHINTFPPHLLNHRSFNNCGALKDQDYRCFLFLQGYIRIGHRL